MTKRKIYLSILHAFLNLRRLILEGCTSLSKVHPSIGALNKVVFLKLAGCKNLKSFLRSICMESLEILTLSRCSKLKKFPEVQGCMKHLSELSLEGTGIKGLPLSIEYLTRLVLLNLRNCQNLESLSSCIYKLRSLEILILSYCLKLKELPEVLENMWSLLELFLDGTAIKELPSSIQHLSGLVLLNLRECKSLAILPQHLYIEIPSNSYSIWFLKTRQFARGFGEPTRFREAQSSRNCYKRAATLYFSFGKTLKYYHLRDVKD